MTTPQPDYFTGYRSLKMACDGHGVLVVAFHSNEKSLIFTARDHMDFVAAFYRIAEDRANAPVILTYGAVCMTRLSNSRELASIRVSLIAAVEGRANVHSEYACLPLDPNAIDCGRAAQCVSLDTLLVRLSINATFALARSYGGYSTNLPLNDLTDK